MKDVFFSGLFGIFFIQGIVDERFRSVSEFHQPRRFRYGVGGYIVIFCCRLSPGLGKWLLEHVEKNERAVYAMPICKRSSYPSTLATLLR